jgi:hypothetical protein
VAGYTSVGNNNNYAPDTPTYGYDYITVVATLATHFARGTATISSVNGANLLAIDPVVSWIRQTKR